jgi:hypothetical protein
LFSCQSTFWPTIICIYFVTCINSSTGIQVYIAEFFILKYYLQQLIVYIIIKYMVTKINYATQSIGIEHEKTIVYSWNRENEKSLKQESKNYLILLKKFIYQKVTNLIRNTSLSLHQKHSGKPWQTITCLTFSRFDLCYWIDCDKVDCLLSPMRGLCHHSINCNYRRNWNQREKRENLWVYILQAYIAYYECIEPN